MQYLSFELAMARESELRRTANRPGAAVIRELRSPPRRRILRLSSRVR